MKYKSRLPLIIMIIISWGLAYLIVKSVISIAGLIG